MTVALAPSGTAGASTPNTAALQLSGDIDVRFRIKSNDWTPTGSRVLVSKWEETGNQRSWRIFLLAAGTLSFQNSTNGTNTTQVVSDPLGFADGSTHWVRVVFQPNSGGSRRLRVYTLDDEGEWVRIGTEVTGTTTSIFSASTAVFRVGSSNGGAFTSPDGRIEQTQLRNGIDGTLVASPDFRLQAAGVTSFTDGTGRAWTVNSPAALTDDGLATPTLKAWQPSSDDILDLNGIHRRTDSFRFELCDRDLNPIRDIHPSTDSTISIRNDMSSRRLSGLTLMADEAEYVDPIAHRLRVYMQLQNGEEYRLGTFLWVDDSRPLRSWGLERASELSDYTHILNQSTSRAYGWGRGANIALIMLFFVGQAGFELADVAVVGEEASRVLAEPMAWQPGTTWTQALEDLGSLVGFTKPWFDRDGRLHLDQAPDPSTTTPVIPAYEAGTRIIADSIVRSNDLLSAPNDIVVTDSGTSRLRTGRYQIPASAPHSFANRGYRVGKAETTQGTSSQAQIDKAARNLARTAADAYEMVTFSSTLDPRHDTHDVIEAFGETWLETAWSMDLKSGGQMNHTLKRVSYDVT